MLKRIEKDGNLYAILIRAGFESPKKYNFVTGPEAGLQVGLNFYQSGEVIKTHMHHPHGRTVERTEEVLLLQRGSMRCRIYDESRTVIAEELMSAGDILYLARGGHGFDLLEDSQIFEVKQGPYLDNDADKIIF